MKTKVTLIGMGNMGTAIAKALTSSQTISLTLWNRTISKAKSFAEKRDVNLADSISDAVSASDLIFICVLDYDVTMQILQTEGVVQIMNSKTVLQVSNGSYGDVGRLTSWTEEHNISYLDGSLMGTPENLDGVAVSGPFELWNTFSDVIKLIGSQSIYVGPNRSASKAMNTAITGTMGTALIGFIHGAAIVNACGIPVAEYTNVCTGLLGMLKDLWGKTADNWRSGNRDPQKHGTASTGLWGNEMLHFLHSAQDLGVKSEFIASMMSLFEMTRVSGNHDKDISVLLDILK